MTVKPMLPGATGPCDIHHRTTTAARACAGYHPGIDPETEGSPATRAQEPDEETAPADRGARHYATTPDSRNAIWKSVLGATGGWGCERETFYREVVRDARGYRLNFGMDEPVIFGIAVDVIHGKLMERRLTAGPADDQEAAADDLEYAVRAGMDAARGRATSAPWSDEDWTMLATRASLAGEKLLGIWPNRTKDQRGESVELPEPEGTPPGYPIAWLDQPDDTATQPQRKLYAPHVVGGRGISGKPDYVFVRGGVIVGWVDVKALGRAGVYPAKWAAGEAVAYDHMCTVENGGVLPEWHGYLEYRRLQKPYWALVTDTVSSSSLALADAYFRRWGRALDDGDPDAVSFNPKNCAKCQYRDPIAAVGFAGCAIGVASIEVAPPAEEDASD